MPSLSVRQSLLNFCSSFFSRGISHYPWFSFYKPILFWGVVDDLFHGEKTIFVKEPPQFPIIFIEDTVFQGSLILWGLTYPYFSAFYLFVALLIWGGLNFRWSLFDDVSLFVINYILSINGIDFFKIKKFLPSYLLMTLSSKYVSRIVINSKNE